MKTNFKISNATGITQLSYFNLKLGSNKKLNFLLTFCALFVFVTTSFAQNNLLVPDVWPVGTGNTSGYALYGITSENERVSAFDPFGVSAVLWQSKPNGGGSHDGGFYSPDITIDATKTYRYTLWIKKTGSSSGTSYFGLSTRTSSNVSVTQLLNGTVNTNPYFWTGDLPQLNKWYLVVGYLHPNSYSGSSNGTMYDGVTKQEVTGITFNDYKFGTGATKMRMRSVLFGDTSAGNFQYYWKPTIYEVNAAMPSIDDLMGVNAVDTDAPDIPTGLTVNSFDHESANISWNPSSDNGGGNTVGYYVYNNGNQISTTTGTSTILTGLQANTPFQLSVAAYDNVTIPNVSNQSSPTVNFSTLSSGGGPGQYDPDFAFRINAGGAATTYDGNAFLADQYYTGTQVYQNPATGLAEPYVSERFNTSKTLRYDIPVVDGEYQVILHFAELWWGATGGGSGGVGTRVFNIDIENQVVRNDYDIIEKVGSGISTTETYIVSVQGGELNIKLTSLADGTQGDPKINGIEILGSNFIDPGTPPTTPGSGVWSQSIVNTNDIFYTTGNVGIGVTNPDAPLTVNGRIHTTEVKVDMEGALVPDYVFLQDYNLRTLEQLELAIKELGHLPEIPSAKEMEENGMELKAMNLSLLEKVEELTLYVIQQNKYQLQLEKRTKSLEEKNMIFQASEY